MGEPPLTDAEMIHEARLHHERHELAYRITIPVKLPTPSEMPVAGSFELENGRVTTFRSFRNRAFMPVSEFRSSALRRDETPDDVKEGMRLTEIDFGGRCQNAMELEMEIADGYNLPRRMRPFRWGDAVAIPQEQLSRLEESVEGQRRNAESLAVVFEGQIHVRAPFPRWRVGVYGDEVKLQFDRYGVARPDSFSCGEYEKALLFASNRRKAGEETASRGRLLSLDASYTHSDDLLFIAHELCRHLLRNSGRQIDNHLSSMSADLVRAWTLLREVEFLRLLSDLDHARGCIAAAMLIDEAIRDGRIPLDARVIGKLKTPTTTEFRERAFIEGIVESPARRIRRRRARV